MGQQSGPFTARDIVALEVIKARVKGMADDALPADLVAWGFEISDAFVRLSRARWATDERRQGANGAATGSPSEVVGKTP